MEKEITLTLEQQDELININMTSFREASLLQSIRDTNKWWVKNFLPNAVIERVDRIQPLVYKIKYYNEYVDEAACNLYHSKNNLTLEHNKVGLD